MKKGRRVHPLGQKFSTGNGKKRGKSLARQGGGVPREGGYRGGEERKLMVPRTRRRTGGVDELINLLERKKNPQ